MAMGAAACLSGKLARPRARRSAPPSCSTPIVRSSRQSSVSIGIPTTVTCLSSDEGINTFKEQKLLSRRGVFFRWQCHGLSRVDIDADVV